jgi:hypothetical protein
VETKNLLLLGVGGYLLYQFLGTSSQAAQQSAEPLTTTANGAGVTVSSQAQNVPSQPVLPGVVTAPPATAQVTASVLQQTAAEAGYPAPQLFTVWQWNYFYGQLTNQTKLVDPGVLLPGVPSPETQKLTAQQYAQAMEATGFPIGLNGLGAVQRVNKSYMRKAIQQRGMAPIHGWE